ncbi:hypothetical protein VUR80DRAFT_10075 [Thermomyces stellatus]
MQLPALLTLLPTLALAAPHHKRDARPNIESLRQQFERACGNTTDIVDTVSAGLSGDSRNEVVRTGAELGSSCVDIMNALDRLSSVDGSDSDEAVEAGREGGIVDPTEGGREGVAVDTTDGGREGGVEGDSTVGDGEFVRGRRSPGDELDTELSRSGGAQVEAELGGSDGAELEAELGGPDGVELEAELGGSDGAEVEAELGESGDAGVDAELGESGNAVDQDLGVSDGIEAGLPDGSGNEATGGLNTGT